MSSHGIEEIVTERLMTDLQAEGYRVFREPSRRMVPQFFGNYTPDIVGFRDGRNLAVEVRSSEHSGLPEIGAVTKLFDGHKDWEFRLVWVPAGEKAQRLRKQTNKTVFEFVNQCKELAHQGSHAAAFLLSWATLEAMGRLLMEDNLGRPQTPARIIEKLAGEGIATPSEAQRLRELSKLRNSLIHGELDAKVSGPQSQDMIDILESIAAGAGLKPSRKRAA